MEAAGEIGGRQAGSDTRGLDWHESAGQPLGCPVDGRRRRPSSWTGWQGNGSQPGQGLHELVFPGPALGQMQGEAARGAGEASGQGEEAPPEGLGGKDLLTQTDARGPAGQQLCWLSRRIGDFCGTGATVTVQTW